MATFLQMFEWMFHHPNTVSAEMARVEQVLAADVSARRGVDQDTLSTLREIGRIQAGIIAQIEAEPVATRAVVQDALRLQRAAAGYDLASHMTAMKAAARDLSAAADAVLPKNGEGKTVLTRAANPDEPFAVERFGSAAQIGTLRTAVANMTAAFRDLPIR